ncbi:hypothetical protein [Lacticaseibacillus sp. GG6-2]
MKKWIKLGLAFIVAVSLGAPIAESLSYSQPTLVQATKKKYTEKHVAKLKLGMTEKQVKKLLGVAHAKRSTTWIYTSTGSVSGGRVYFKKGKVSGGTIGTLSKQANTKSNNSKAKKVAPINAAISKSLTEDQGFANGTLDENGNPTQSGTPNSSYDWSTYVISIKVSKSGNSYKVTGQVNSKIAALTDSSKKELAIHIQSLALSTLAELNKASDEALTEGLFTDIKSGKLAVAQSHLTDYKEIRVY